MTYTQKDVFTPTEAEKAAVMNQALHEFPPHASGHQRWSEAFDAHPEWIEALGLSNYEKPTAGARLLYNRLKRKGLIEDVCGNGRSPKLPANSLNDRRIAIVQEASEKYPGPMAGSISWATALKDNPDWIDALGIRRHARPEQGAYLVARKLIDSGLVPKFTGRPAATGNGNGNRLHWTQRPGGREKMRQAQLAHHRTKKRGPYKTKLKAGGPQAVELVNAAETANVMAAVPSFRYCPHCTFPIAVAVTGFNKEMTTRQK